MMTQTTNGNVSFWYADIGGVPAYRPPLPGNRRADICIVGAGYTGLWTAYYLKQANPALDIAIVEKEFAGYGASGRNGGSLSGGFGWSRKKYLQNSTRAQIIAFERALMETVGEIDRVTRAEGIEADLHLTDGLRVACTPAQMARLRQRMSEAANWDQPEGRSELIDGAALRDRINVPNALGALVTHGVARIQPAKLVRGLAATVARMGVKIYEQTCALDIRKGEVVTDRGVVQAERIVRATEGYTASLEAFRKLWIPLNSAIIVTEPLGPEIWDKIGWANGETLGDASHVYAYSQRTRDNRITMGGRGIPYRFGSAVDHNGVTQAESIRQLRAMLFRLLPQLRDVQIDHAWCGVLGTPRDWCATVGLDEKTGIAWAGGYVGLGISTSNLAGRTLADLLLDRKTDLTRMPWVNREVRAWEPEPFRWLGIRSMYKLYHMADRRETARNLPSTSRLASFADWLTGR